MVAASGCMPRDTCVRLGMRTPVTKPFSGAELKRQVMLDSGV